MTAELKQHAENLRQLLELVVNAEASLLTTTYIEAERTEEFLRDGLVRLERAVAFAKSFGYFEYAEVLEDRGALFADAYGSDERNAAANALREARIELRLALDAATDAAGMLRVPPGQVVVHGPRKSEKVPRNKPCPCGSGRKYKRCCGAN